MGISAVMWVSLAFQALLNSANILTIRGHKLVRKAQPELWQDWIVNLFGIAALVLTAAHKAIFSSTWPVIAVAAIIVGLGLLPPIVGFIENRCRAHGDEVFALSRFPGHLVSNFFGASAVAAFYWVGQSTAGFTAFTQKFSDASAFNVVLPLATMVIFAFVRQQQVSQCPDLDQLVQDKGDWASRLRGYSLRDRHQLLNCVYLIAALFMGASTILYLLGYTVVQAKHGAPVPFSAHMAIAMVTLMAFLFACGTPWSWGNRTVYFSFLTGTPGALIAAMIWLTLMAPSTARNVFAIVLVGLGYVSYCAAAVFGVLYGRHALTAQAPDDGGTVPATRSAETVELHYFAAAILAVALAVLVGVLYVSQ